jgi:lysophospholipase L1-like esterase
VRIAWLGDSHAQADFWPDALRRGLQQRFGSAGPGFVHLGFEAYRHAGVKIDILGSWRMRPKQPSSVEPWGDGAFGLGGILHAGWGVERRRASVELTDERLAGRRLRWDLCYKYGLPADRFRVQLGDGAEQVFAVKGEEEIGKLEHVELEARGLAKLTVLVDDGRPDFCGLTVETFADEHPGVVLDNLGINGARYGTALAWNEQSWAAEVLRRTPDLFILEYGGNEAGDRPNTPARYAEQALELWARARRIRADASCLMIGPSERIDAGANVPPVVAALEGAAGEAGCMFWNTYQVMGGKGSIERWQEDERAAPDGVHLKPKGYAEVGALLLGDLMAGYRPRDASAR